ncbi:uncharacterized protein LACBIDRAFT_317851 [Laccaria bicolor S238N-H82]|uniref:Predicted protein n=1 Tax=Laccaria bicolor (strain S238N-H82 / ATCC MYA-4686) TaxID=486041 RepID=B0D5D8_LACBS|nr:uncharacterized protein LACBIDRAFT_317851 [Laccaria bicolor S238N-H82]EDR10002.1 predicted protein [Laccaria bicolor S238N-H82]|eukprot:XP_001879387.1 predicted protein [Laccaria bicolor S238N-H82]
MGRWFMRALNQVMSWKKERAENDLYHFSRVGLPVDLGINDWVCDPCKSMKKSRGRGGK